MISLLQRKMHKSLFMARKVSHLFLFIFCLFSFSNTSASHFVGGQITWECLSTGKYVFNLQAYVDCSGASWPFYGTHLSIYGTPLPRGNNNQAFDSIPLNPDFSKWTASNYGKFNPQCEFDNSNNYGLRCENGERGTIQIYYYKSDTIQLNGTPPKSGWRFSYEAPCCRPRLTNLAEVPTTRTLINAIIYPLDSTKNTSPCFDTSPIFAENPWVPNCQNSNIHLNLSATDKNFDSVIYSFSYPQDAPASNPIRRNYKPGYSFSNPTPDTSFNSSNIPSNINKYSGIYTAKVAKISFNDRFLIIIRANAYKNGQKVASVFNEFPLYTFDCPPIPALNTQNSNPSYTFRNNIQDSIEVTVKAGELVNIPFSIVDTDTNYSGTPQNVRLTFSSLLFSTNLTDTSNCINPPCAVITSQKIAYDSLENEYDIRSNHSISSSFEWLTSCNHLLSDSTISTYRFYFNGQDDFCPIPAKKDAYIKVNIEPLNMNGLTISNDTIYSLDQVHSYQWLDCLADTIIPGETQSYFSPTYNSNYAVITQNGVCIDTSDCIPFTAIGIGDINYISQIKLYPNPTNGKINISAPDEVKIKRIEVRTINGQLTKEFSFPFNTQANNIYFDGIAGVYVLKIITHNDEYLISKIIKTKL